MEFMTDCEQIVMKCVWDAEQDISLQEVIKVLEGYYHKNWKRQTVSTFLGHLSEKGFVGSRREGRVFYYYPLVDEKDYRNQQTKDFLEFWYKGSATEMVASMSEQTSLTSEEVARLKKLAEELH